MYKFKLKLKGKSTMKFFSKCPKNSLDGCFLPFLVLNLYMTIFLTKKLLYLYFGCLLTDLDEILTIDVKLNFERT